MTKLALHSSLRAIPAVIILLSVATMSGDEAIATPAPAAPPAAFSACAACHSVVPGQKRMGPNLAGVAGRAAGSLDGFSYSPALKASGLTWNAAELDRWIANPKAAVPGNKMPYAGMQDAAKRKQIVDYLGTLR